MNKEQLRQKINALREIDPLYWPPQSLKLVELALSLADYIIEKMPNGKTVKEQEIPAGFIKVSIFSNKYNLASPGWLINVFNLIDLKQIDFNHIARKIKGIWFIHPQNLINFFAHQGNIKRYPVMHRRCKRYLESLENS